MVVIYNSINNWEVYEKELTVFPYARHDDMADAFSLGINFYNEFVDQVGFWGFSQLAEGMYVHRQRPPIDTTIIKENYLSGRSQSLNDHYARTVNTATEASSFL